MNFFEKELRNMFGKSEMLQDAKFCGRAMISKLDDELRLKLQFISFAVADHYNAIEAKIINRTEGEVDKQVFRFVDIIGMRTSHIGDREPYIWNYNGNVDWYTPISDSQKAQIAQSVLDYAGMFQDTGIVQSM